MEQQFIYETIGQGVFGWILSKLLDKGYDLIKAKTKKEKDEFEQIIDIIISKYPSEDINREHFISLFQDEAVIKNLKDFEDGQDSISIELLNKTLNRIVFGNNEGKNEIISKIVLDLLEEIKCFIFNEPTYNAYFTNSILTQLRKSSGSYAQNILISIDSVSQQIDKRFTKNDESQAQILDGINELKKLIITNPEQLQNTNDKNINKIIKIANDFLNEGKILAARKIYLELLGRVSKTDVDLIWKLNSNIGKTYINEADEQEGIKYFIEAYKLFPEDEKGLIQLAYAKLIERNLIEAEPILEKILSKNTKSEEALTIKCNLYTVHGFYTKAIEAIKLTSLNNYQTLYTYGFALFKSGEIGTSKDYLIKSLEYERSPMTLDLIATILVEQVKTTLNDEKPLRLRKDDLLYNLLLEAQKYLDEAIDLYEKRESTKLLASAYHNRGVLYSLSQNKDKCLDDFKKSQELGLNEGIVYLNLGIAYIQNSKYEKAVDCFDQAMKLGEKNAFDYYINALLLSNDLLRAKKLILEKISGKIEDINDDNLMCYLVLVEIYSRELEEVESKSIRKILRDKYPNNIFVLEREIYYLKEEKQIEEAINLAEKYLAVSEQKRDLIIYILAELYFEQHNWEKSEKLLERLIDFDNYGNIERHYLYSVFNQGHYNQALEVISKFETNSNIQLKEFQRLKGDVLFYYDRFIESKELFKILAINYNKVDDYVKWGLSEFRLGYFEKASVVLKNALERFHDKPKDLLRISSAYLIIGKTREALDLAFGVLQKLPDNIDAVKNFLITFLSHTHQNPKDPIPESIINAFRNNLDSYEKNFPNDHSWQKKDVGKDFNELKNMLRENEQFHKNIHELYDFHRLPLSIVSKLVGRNIYETWAGLCNQNERRIWAYSTNNSKKELQLMQDYKGEIVVEPIAFFTLFSLDRIDLLNTFTQVYFPQRLLDILHQEISTLKMSATSGLLSVYSLDGQLYKNEIPAWEIEKSIKRILEMIEYIKGKTVGFDIEKTEVKEEIELLQHFDESTKQAFQFASKNNIPLLIDESSLSEYFQGINNIKTFSSLTLLRLSRYKKIITTPEFNSFLLKLISANYYFISVNADMILQGLKQQNFQMSYYSQSILKYLNHHDINEVSVANVLADFFVGLYSEDIGELRKNTWIDYSLDCLPRNKLNTTALLKLINDRVINKFNSLIEYRSIIEWLDMRMNTWSISRCVPYFK